MYRIKKWQFLLAGEQRLLSTLRVYRMHAVYAGMHAGLGQRLLSMLGKLNFRGIIGVGVVRKRRPPHTVEKYIYALICAAFEISE